jgi:hypothetical protein
VVPQGAPGDAFIDQVADEERYPLVAGRPGDRGSRLLAAATVAGDDADRQPGSRQRFRESTPDARGPSGHDGRPLVSNHWSVLV